MGDGDAPCVVLMVGAHVSRKCGTRCLTFAARFGASVEKETSDPEQAKETAERFRRERPSESTIAPT